MVDPETRERYLETCSLFGREDGEPDGKVGFELTSTECVNCSKTEREMYKECAEECGVELEVTTTVGKSVTREDAKPQVEEPVETPPDVAESPESNNQDEKVVIDVGAGESGLDDDSGVSCKLIDWAGKGTYTEADGVLVKTDSPVIGDFNLKDIPEGVKDVSKPAKEKTKLKIKKENKTQSTAERIVEIMLSEPITRQELIEKLGQETELSPATILTHVNFATKYGVAFGILSKDGKVYNSNE